VNYLLEAVPPDLPLEIHGGAFDAAYFEHLQGLARGKQVKFVLRSSDEELVAAYRRALCVVLPSVYRSVCGRETAIPELLGQTLLEGMACGLPAVCTNVASMPEVVLDGVTGFVVPPNDPAALREKLCWLRDHPEEARALGRAARQRALEVFNWPGVVRRCLEIYRQA
jgi:glycosyltransferase involved in cell wall biosynthesis